MHPHCSWVEVSWEEGMQFSVLHFRSILTSPNKELEVGTVLWSKSPPVLESWSPEPVSVLNPGTI